MKTHKVIDVVAYDDIDVALFCGSIGECYEWKLQQGFGYRVVPLDEKERVIANSEDD